MSMDYVKAALATVGLVQLLKSFIPLKNTRAWCIITIITGVGLTLVVKYLLPIVIDCVFVVCGSTLFYDTIYKSFEKLFTKVNTEGGIVNEIDAK